MATGIISIIIVLITIFSVKSYMKKLAGGCCGGTVEPKQRKHKNKNISDYKFSKTIYIEGMKCKNCANHIENELSHLENTFAEVDLKNKLAKVKMKSNIEDQILKRTVEKTGYSVISINSNN
ncbi:hypothetical protein UT300005_08740 [Clostridium sp. CTA-5]